METSTKLRLGHQDIHQILGKVIRADHSMYLIKWKPSLGLHNTWEPGEHFQSELKFMACLHKFEQMPGSCPWSKIDHSAQIACQGLVQLDCESPLDCLGKSSKPPAPKMGLQDFIMDLRRAKSKSGANPIAPYLNYRNKLTNQHLRLQQFVCRNRPFRRVSETKVHSHKSERSHKIRKFIKNQNSRNRLIKKNDRHNKARLLAKQLAKCEETDEETLVYKNCLDMIDGISSVKGPFARRDDIRPQKTRCSIRGRDQRLIESESGTPSEFN